MAWTRLVASVAALLGLPAAAGPVSMTIDGPPSGTVQWFLDDAVPVSATADPTGCDPGPFSLPIRARSPGSPYAGTVDQSDAVTAAGTAPRQPVGGRRVMGRGGVHGRRRPGARHRERAPHARRQRDRDDAAARGVRNACRAR